MALWSAKQTHKYLFKLTLCDGAHEHGGRCGVAKARHMHALASQTSSECGSQDRAADAGVPSYLKSANFLPDTSDPSEQLINMCPQLGRLHTSKCKFAEDWRNTETLSEAVGMLKRLASCSAKPAPRKNAIVGVMLRFSPSTPVQGERF